MKEDGEQKAAFLVTQGVSPGLEAIGAGGGPRIFRRCLLDAHVT